MSEPVFAEHVLTFALAGLFDSIGYGATSFPGVTEALSLDRSPAQAREQVERLIKALRRTVKLLKSKADE